MENHIHWIAMADDITKQVAAFKSFTGLAIVRYLQQQEDFRLLGKLRCQQTERGKDRIHQLWQDDNHPEAIISEAMMLQKLEYIHNNPVKRGYVDDPAHWRYSSARDYAGVEGLLPVDRDW